MRFSFIPNSRFKVTAAALLFSIAASHGYEQGSYFIFNLVNNTDSKQSSVTTIRIPAETLKLTKSATAKVDKAASESSSEFLIDLNSTPTGTSVFDSSASQSHAFTIDTAVTTEEDSSLKLTTDSVFGN